MGKKGSIGKVILIISVFLAYFSVFSYFLLDSIGAWWFVEIDPIIGTTQTAYLNAFGYFGKTGEELQLVLGTLGIFGAILFLVGPVLTIISILKESKILAYLGFFLMLSALGIFLFGLASVQDFESILEGLNFLTGDEYLVFFGSVDLGLFGIWSWMIGVGFYIAVIATILTLIGAIKLN
jgi:hypothetical protein